MKNSSNFYLLKTSCLTLALFCFSKANAYSYKETNIEIYLSNIKKLGQERVLEIENNNLRELDPVDREIKTRDLLDGVHEKKIETQSPKPIFQAPPVAKKEIKKKILAELQNDKKLKLKIDTRNIKKEKENQNGAAQKTILNPKENIDFTAKTLEVSDKKQDIVAESLEENKNLIDPVISQDTENLGEIVRQVESLGIDDQNSKIKSSQEENTSEIKNSYQSSDIIVNNLDQNLEVENKNQQKEKKWYNHFFPKKSEVQVRDSNISPIDQIPEEKLPLIPSNDQETSNFSSEIIEEEMNIDESNRQSSVKIKGDNSLLTMKCEKILDDNEKAKIDNLIKNALSSKKQITIIAYNNSPEDFKEEKKILKKLVEIREYLENNGLSTDYITTKILSKNGEDSLYDHKIINFYLT